MPTLRIEVVERHRLKQRGELVFYRPVEGEQEVSAGMEFVADRGADRWCVAGNTAFIDPPPLVGFVRRPFAVLVPLGTRRKIEVGELFHAVSPAPDN